MPRRSKITQLPKAVKEWLDTQLIDKNFSGYDVLVKEANALLKTHGVDFRLSRTGVHRYGQDFEGRLAQLKASSEQAQAVVAALPDEEDAMAQALVRLTQQKLFEVINALDVDPETVNLSGLTRSIAELTRASTVAKDYAAKVKARAQAAASTAQDMLRHEGLSEDKIEAIKTVILGVGR